jgi:hypothetical protein
MVLASRSGHLQHQRSGIVFMVRLEAQRTFSGNSLSKNFQASKAVESIDCGLRLSVESRQNVG